MLDEDCTLDGAIALVLDAALETCIWLDAWLERLLLVFSWLDDAFDPVHAGIKVTIARRVKHCQAFARISGVNIRVTIGCGVVGCLLTRLYQACVLRLRVTG